MQLSTSSINSSSSLSVDKYKVEGGVTIRDKTNGSGKVIFSSQLSTKYQKSVYEVFINGKKLIFPTCSNPSLAGTLLCIGSIKIKFKQKNEFIKIKDVNEISKIVLYVDPRKPVDGIAYDVYSYRPKEISKEIAMKKIESLEADFPHFKRDVVVYNRHGVAVFGWDTNDNAYALYWAKPSQDEKIKKMKCSICHRSREGETLIANSEDGNVSFRYSGDKGYYLNEEPATLLAFPKTDEYKLEGGVTIHDKTNGMGKVIFSSTLSAKHQKSVYEVFINDKKLIFPTCSDPRSGGTILCMGSIKIKFTQKNEFIKITELDATSKSVFYVDPRKPVDGIAYDIYSHIPREISKEIATKKIESLKTDFPHFRGEAAVYNRHGVAVFGRDTTDNADALYWASPSQDEKVKKMKCSGSARFRDGGSFFAKSQDGNVNFRYSVGTGYYLNAEAATRIELTK